MAQGAETCDRTRSAYAFLEPPGLDAQHPFVKAIKDGNGAKGIVLTEHGPAMLVVAPVLDGAGNGPHRGAVLLARVITPDVAARLAEQAQVKLKVATPLTPTADIAAERESLLLPRIVTLEYTNQVYRNLKTSTAIRR